MADNTTINAGSGGDLIASDDIGGVKFQRIKLIHGADNVNDGDVSAANPLPIRYSDITVTGAFTAAEQAATIAALDGRGTVMVQTSGTYTATGVFEVTLDGTTWTSTNAYWINNNVYVSSSSAPNLFFVATAGYRGFRFRCSAYTSGTLNVTLVGIGADASSRSPLPTGPNTIGLVGQSGTWNVSGSGATNLGKAEDTAHASGDVGVFTLGVRRDSPAVDTDVAGDYAAFQIDSRGQQWTRTGVGISGGATPYKLISASGTNATNVKAAPGNLYSIVAVNTSASLKYLKIYNLAVAPTVGTSVPVQVYPLAASGGGVSLSLATGLSLNTGIALATTGGAADADTTGVAANDVIVSLTFN